MSNDVNEIMAVDRMLLVTRSWELRLMGGDGGDGAVSTVCHLDRQLGHGSDFYQFANFCSTPPATSMPHMTGHS